MAEHLRRSAYGAFEILGAKRNRLLGQTTMLILTRSVITAMMLNMTYAAQHTPKLRKIENEIISKLQIFEHVQTFHFFFTKNAVIS
jgi:hypothetical protein